VIFTGTCGPRGSAKSKGPFRIRIAVEGSLMHGFVNAFVSCLAVGWMVAATACCAKEPRDAEFKIAVEKIQPVTPEMKRQVQEWIIDLESTPLLASKLAVVVTGEYFTGGTKQGVESVNAKQFAMCWATQEGTKDQRVIFQEQSLLDPVLREADGGRYMQSSSNDLDQLKKRDKYFEASGRRVYPESTKPRLEQPLKLAGAFYPITAATATVTEWYRGSVAKPTSARVEIERLTGFYRQGDRVVAEFYYQSSEISVLHRLVVFKQGVPVQVEDRMAFAFKSNDRFRIVSLLRPEQDDLEQMQRTRKEAIPLALTRIQWGKIEPDLRVPIALDAKTVNGPNAIEAVAKCVWFVNDEVSPVIFDARSVGLLTPLELINRSID
jgi:hypothetical protein